MVRINETQRVHDALQYPLMFCHGKDGYFITISQRDPNSTMPIKKQFLLQTFTLIKLWKDKGEVTTSYYIRSLLNQFLVDCMPR